jgi:hypothetical protein
MMLNDTTYCFGAPAQFRQGGERISRTGAGIEQRADYGI